jgi:hypothetical protein
MKFLIASAVALLVTAGLASPAFAVDTTPAKDQNATTTDKTNDAKTGTEVTEPKSSSEKMNGDSSSPMKK